jgi:enoyl-CoA hydratase/carnithine racemase
MEGPIRLVRSDEIPEYKNIEPIYEWSEGSTYLMIDRVVFKGKSGSVLCYYNPPVHQVGNPGLDAYLEGLEKVFEKRSNLEFLLICGANDPVHAGGDLKESLKRLDKTLEIKQEKESAGASAEEIDRLFDWADNRIKKGVALHGSIRAIAGHLRVVAICGGGTRFGGSAEIPLMADFIVGDSRSGMCFSEAMIGIIPGWSGVARTLVKAGRINAEYMAKTSREVKADELKAIGVYNIVVDVPFSFPKRKKTDDPEGDKARYLEALEVHNHDTGLLLFPKGLEIATCPAEAVPVIGEKERMTLASREDICAEVERRKNPENYASLRGKPLREVKEEIVKTGRPLAPQAIDALNNLLKDYDPFKFDENAFVKNEGNADSMLYRDARFRAGLIATLEQRVADYGEAK